MTPTWRSPTRSPRAGRRRPIQRCTGWIERSTESGKRLANARRFFLCRTGAHPLEHAPHVRKGVDRSDVAFTGLTVTGAAGGLPRARAPFPARCAAADAVRVRDVVLLADRRRRAAVLRGAHPGKNPTQVRNALQQPANPAALGDGSTRIDQGNGLLDIAAADALLAVRQGQLACARCRQATPS